MDKQIKTIIKFLIRETPIGHIKSTIDNIKIILGIEITDDPEIIEELIHYENEHLRFVNVGDDKIILSNIVKDTNGLYHDQNKNLKIAISPLNENIDRIEDVNSEECKIRACL
jgi:hypothetical protein